MFNWNGPHTNKIRTGSALTPEMLEKARDMFWGMGELKEKKMATFGLYDRWNGFAQEYPVAKSNKMKEEMTLCSEILWK